MAGSSDRIALRGLRFEGRHGVLDEERRYPQLLEVDVELEADLELAAHSDELADTIDYGPLVEIVRVAVEEHSHRLLESLARRIIDAILAMHPTPDAVSVRVRKLAVPVDADLDYAEVSLRRARFEDRPPSA